MRKSFNIFSAALLGFAAAGGAQAAISYVDVSALGSGGTTVALAAGTYTVNFVDRAGDGGYTAWNPWSGVVGCTGAGTNCVNGWVMSLAIDFGFGTGNFNRQNGFQYGEIGVPGDNHQYATAEAALLNFQTTPNIVFAPLPTATDLSTYLPTGNPISFTLLTDQSVNFFILDNPYGDNQGGVSFGLDDGISAPNPVPEPASWAMMIGGLGLVGAAMRRRATRIAFA